MKQIHPANWPLAVWFVLSLAAAFVQVDYTVGLYSFAPAVALLSGTWKGPRDAVLVQGLTAAALLVIASSAPGTVSAGEWGFRIGVIITAGLAGLIARPDGNGAHPATAVRLTVFSVAGLSLALVPIIAPRMNYGSLFAMTFVLGTAIAVFYAYKLVPEPGRVIGYAFCLIPYYALGIGWTLFLTRWNPAAAVLAGVPGRWYEVLFSTLR